MYNDLLYCKKLAYHCQYVLDWLDEDVEKTHFPPDCKIIHIETIDVNPHGKKCVIFYETKNKNNYFFCKRDLFNILPNLITNNSNYIFFIVDGDPHFGQKELNLLLQTKFMYCYAQHLDIIHEKVLPYPVGLGIAYKLQELELCSIFNNLSLYKECDVYINFNPNNKIRNECLNNIGKYNNDYNTKFGKVNYLTRLAESYFSLSPGGSGGNGDSFRMWESLYCNTIPISTHNIINDYFSKFFPILLVNNWSELNIKNLTKSRYEDILSKYPNTLVTGRWQDYLNFDYFINSNYLQHQVINL